MIERDRFGVEMLYPTIPNGREWFSKWDNGHARALENVENDPDDAEFHLRGNAGALTIDGLGIARMSGASPRMYVYQGDQKWRNTEVTFYARRVDEYEHKSSQGFVVGARSEHQDIATRPCNAHTYYGRVLYDGRVNFQKELWHRGGEQVYAAPRSGGPPVSWNPPCPELPRGEWVGIKYIVRNLKRDTQVRLELLRDRSGGMGPGVWEPIARLDDTGDWTAESDCLHPAGQIFTEAATSVFIRNDCLVSAEYARFSIREIAPL